MRKLRALIPAAALVATSCVTNPASVFVANPCDSDMWVRLDYAAMFPGGDVDQLAGKVEAGSIRDIGTLGEENLYGAVLEAYTDPLYSREARGLSYSTPPPITEVEGREGYFFTLPRCWETP